MLAQEKLSLGISLTLFSGLFYSLQTVLVKWYASVLPALPVVVFIQSAVALLLMLPFLLKKGTVNHALAFKHLPLHLLRTCCSLGISYLLFYAVQFIPLVNAILLVNTAPLFVPLLAYIFFSQKINIWLGLALLVGFLGVILVLHPTGGRWHPAFLLALAAGICWATTMVIVRQLSAKSTPQTTVFYFFILSTLFSGVISIKFWASLSLTAVLIMISMGMLYFLTQYTATLALRHARAQVVSILFYINIVYAAFFSMWFWHLRLTDATCVGIVCIVLGGIGAILIEYRYRSPSYRLK